MKKCKCGSYAVNIERFTGDNCDVCHYKNKADALAIEIEKFKCANKLLKESLFSMREQLAEKQDQSIDLK